MSRILDRGPHTVTIYPEESFVDSYGNTVKRPAATGVVVSGCQLTPQLISRVAWADDETMVGAGIDGRLTPAVREVLTVAGSIDSRNGVGGTATARVAEQLVADAKAVDAELRA